MNNPRRLVDIRYNYARLTIFFAKGYYISEFVSSIVPKHLWEIETDDEYSYIVIDASAE